MHIEPWQLGCLLLKDARVVGYPSRPGLGSLLGAAGISLSYRARAGVQFLKDRRLAEAIEDIYQIRCMSVAKTPWRWFSYLGQTSIGPVVTSG